MKKDFEDPKVEITRFGIMDVITTSSEMIPEVDGVGGILLFSDLSVSCAHKDHRITSFRGSTAKLQYPFIEFFR